MDFQQVKAADHTYYMPTFGERQPVCFVSGEGCILTDTNGKHYTDFLAGIATVSLGHAHPAVLKTLTEQAATLTHISNHFYNVPQARLAQVLCETSAAARVFFGNSGGEANEAALKLARKWFSGQGLPQYEIISAHNSFHGRTLATIAATGQEKYQKPFRPMPAGFINIPYGDMDALLAALTPNTAAVFLETIQGEGGVVMPPEGYLQAVRELCTAQGILLIFDEVQTGMGRTGALWHHQQLGVQPDIWTTAKALGNGFPIGAVMAVEPYATAFQPGDHGTTFGGNPLACSVALTVMDEMTKPAFMAHVQTTGMYFMQGLQALQAKHAVIKEVRGAGLIIGAELDASLPGAGVVSKALERGYVINCAAHNTLRFVPPLVVTQAEIDGLLDVLDIILP